MHFHARPDWHLPAKTVTPESRYRERPRARREFLRKLGVGAAGLLASPVLRGATEGFPAQINDAYTADGLKPTSYEAITNYNNFYEFGTGKDDPVHYANQGWQTEPWTIELAGHIRNPGLHDVNALIRQLGGIEERVYRHRCVEAWSMVVPWDGFPLAKLVALADPTAEAKYLKFTTFVDRSAAIGQRSDILDWPYLEGLRLDEATHDLAFIATGIYGKPIPNQNGAPLRLVVPWKYGFKGIKSIVKIEFTATEPRNTWQDMAPHEYGFYANVNPQVSHPRWSQAEERIIGDGFFAGKKPTLMFNGYEAQVAGLYRDLDLRKFY